MPDPQLLLTPAQKTLIQLSRFLLSDTKVVKLFKLIKTKTIPEEKVKEYLDEAPDSQFINLLMKYLIPSVRKFIRWNSLIFVLLHLVKVFKLPGLPIAQLMQSHVVPITQSLSFIPLISQAVNLFINNKNKNKNDNNSKTNTLVEMITALSIFHKTQLTSKLSFKIKLYLSFYSLFFVGQSALTSIYRWIKSPIDNELIAKYQNTFFVKAVKKLIMTGMLVNIYDTYQEDPEMVPGLISKLVAVLQSNLEPLSTTNSSSSLISILRLIGGKWIRVTVSIFIASALLKICETVKTEYSQFKESHDVSKMIKSSLKSSTILTLTFSILHAYHRSSNKSKRRIKFITMVPLSFLVIDKSDFARSYLLKAFLLTRFTKLILQNKASTIVGAGGRSPDWVLNKLTELALVGGVIGAGSTTGSFDELDEGRKGLARIRGLFMGLL